MKKDSSSLHPYEYMYRSARADHLRRDFFVILASAVVFVTVYFLILPAITMDQSRAAETPGVVLTDEGTYLYTMDNAAADPADAWQGADPGDAWQEYDQGDVWQENGTGGSWQENGTGDGWQNFYTTDPWLTDDDADDGEWISFDTDTLSGFIVMLQTIEKTYLASDGYNYRIRVDYPEEAGIPDGAELEVMEVLPASQGFSGMPSAYGMRYEDYVASTESALSENEKVVFARFFDIKIMKDGQEIQPAVPVDVKIELADELTEDVKAVHFEQSSEEETGQVVLLSAERSDAELLTDAVTFEADGFSVYGIFMTIETTVVTAEGETYRIRVSYGPDAGIPEGAGLDVKEILPEEETPDGSAEYEAYLERTGETLGIAAGDFAYARFFDIRITDAYGEKVEIAAPVDVNVELADRESTEEAENTTQVVHFPDDDNAAGEVISDLRMETAEDNEAVLSLSFAADGFSVYAIVDAPEPAVTADGIKIADLRELAEKYADRAGFYLSCGNTSYFTNTLNGNSCYTETTNVTEASRWYFEQDGSADNTYVIYTWTDGEKRYMQNPGGNLAGLTADSSSAVRFEISEAGNSKFYFRKTGKNLWLQHSNGGGGIRFYTDKNNAANSQISITYASSLEMEDDPYSLDGKSYGIAYYDDAAISAALTAEPVTVSNQSRLAALDMLMRPDVLDNDGILLVAEGSTIQEWTFHSLGEDTYSITTDVDGKTKYLTIGDGAVMLADEPDETASVITATPGTDSYSGKWHFTAGGYSVSLPNGSGKGFTSSTGSNAVTWMNLVEKSVLEDDDFQLYTARKVSVSDTANVYSSQQVVIYTRVWNETKKKYEFYAVDHDGSLIRCYDTGDNIEWIGSLVNTALWTFTEGRNTDGTPNYYYWLENAQFHHEFLVPQATAAQVIYTSSELDGTSDFSASVNLNGRRNGEPYTTIICWDGDQYSYSGLKVENGHVVPCALAEAEDFYLAVTNPIDGTDTLTTVSTIDNAEYGISMKLIDYQSPILNASGKAANNTTGRDSGQTSVLGYNTNTAGLLSSLLETNGYPDTIGDKTGKESTSLSALYSGASAVNHLFIKSIHDESGYFEYDSTQNFAHLEDNGDFTVYDQLGAIGDYAGAAGTGRHGQFMPYNELTAGKYVTLFGNETDVLARELPDTNPRKGEKLYNIGTQKEADYFFGMEMEAGFTQTADGLDAWGHDIIFEFSGDDDFWFYVDGVLVLDLGGVHSAMTGSINFRTGEVKSSRGNSTLYETFRAVLGDRADDLFETRTVNGKEVRVFKDYTSHALKMFYMERGAGASNLHMRFNLAAVKPGTVELSKRLSGTDSASNNLIAFPYQIHYTDRKDHEDHILGENPGEEARVTYKDTVNPVPCSAAYTPAGGSDAYSHVFFLKAGETAVIDLPDDALDYYIVECGVNPDVYDHVYANGTEADGSDTPNMAGTTARKDYRTSAATAEERPSVEYDNHVAEGAMRTLNITKKLYDTDGVTLLQYDATEAEKADKLEDKTMFEYRLYLGNEYTDPDSLSGAFLYPYYVKNRDGEYCRWNAATRSFVSVNISKYPDLQAYLKTLSAAEKETIVFTTSPNGSISRIPAGYTVEVRDLIVGTRWKVVERDAEIPKGYTRREADGYARTDAGHETEQMDPVGGIMEKDESPAVEVRNQRGWGLTVKKNWSDKDFMESHDTIYFAVYVHNRNGGQDAYAAVPEYQTITETEEDGTTIVRTVIDHYKPAVRQLTADSTELYYFFGDLHNNTADTYQFSDYYVREVSITVPETAPEGTGIEVDDDGFVIHPEELTVAPVDPEGVLSVNGTPLGGEYQAASYQVSYTTGQSTGANENIRTDIVTNSRPGIELYKTDWTGAWVDGADGETTLSGALAGAVFTIRDSQGKNVAAESYTSGGDGLITTAYLSEGTYTLTEVSTPRGYVRLDHPLSITVNADSSLRFSLPVGDGTDTITMDENGNIEGSSSFFSVQRREASHMTATITIKNRANELKVVKVDASANTPLEGAHFALYHQVTESETREDGTVTEVKRKYYTPISGYSDMVTGADGIPSQTVGEVMNQITAKLAPGTYYLEETQAAAGYDALTEDLCFTIGNDGTVTINSDGHKAWLKADSSAESGKTVYTITIPNGKMKNVSFLKVDIAAPDSAFLAGAEFALYPVIDGKRQDTVYISGLVSDADGMLTEGENTVFALPVGVYHLIETKAPAGYMPKPEAVEIIITEEVDKDSKDFGEGNTLRGVLYREGTALSDSGNGKKYDAGQNVYTLKISNTAGYELPATGGPGTAWLHLSGSMLMALAGLGAVMKRRRRRKLSVWL